MVNARRTIEVEFRSLVSKEKHDELLEYLQQHGEDLGQDDKNVYFFLLPDQLLKVTHNVSQETAKITAKLSKIGERSDFEEIEIAIDPRDVEKTVRMFKALNLAREVQESFQARRNFIYKEVELAVKYSNTWEYHVELEQVVPDESQKEAAEQAIREVADELGLKLMSDEELREFTERKNKEMRSGGHE